MQEAIVLMQIKMKFMLLKQTRKHLKINTNPFSNNIYPDPGDTIVVPRNVERNYHWFL